MAIKEVNRQDNKDGQTVVEFETDKLVVRLINTYDKRKTLEDMIYVIACRKLADRLAS